MSKEEEKSTVPSMSVLKVLTDAKYIGCSSPKKAINQLILKKEFHHWVWCVQNGMGREHTFSLKRNLFLKVASHWLKGKIFYKIYVIKGILP